VTGSTEGPEARRGGRGGLSYNKLCEIEDFEHAELRGLIRMLFSHELKRFGPDFPKGREYRKHWEVAMTYRALQDFGALHEGSQILGVGAGNEPTIFLLTRSAGRVFATDLYLAEGTWSESANASMLTDPARHWPSAWNPLRLVVQHMDALSLRYEDESFDGIFSSSAIEHFGDYEAVQRALAEMHRVLRRGGILALSTEFRLEGSSAGLPEILMFDESELLENIISPFSWTLVSPLELSLSRETRALELSFSAAAADVRAHVSRYGGLFYHELEWSRYPHVLLREGELLWTSLHLVLRKP
jgi:SAM-dependent methyltransferase